MCFISMADEKRGRVVHPRKLLQDHNHAPAEQAEQTDIWCKPSSPDSIFQRCIKPLNNGVCSSLPLHILQAGDCRGQELRGVRTLLAAQCGA